jgi:uncharacterized protein
VVEVTVTRLGIDSGSNSFVVILQEREGDRILPIWIGRAEAESIAVHLDRVERSRPMTHDLAQSLISTLGGVLHHVAITRVHEGTFFAEMHLIQAGATHVVDSRPSDSISIALRLNAPIFAAEELLADHVIEGGETDTPSEGGPPEMSADAGDAHERSAEALQRYLAQLRPEDFGKFRL